MNKFKGFPSTRVRTIRIPEIFFETVLPKLENQLQLRTALLTFWLLEQQEGNTRFLRLDDYLNPPPWFVEDQKESAQTPARIRQVVKKLIEIGMLISAQPLGYTEEIYFLNSERGKALAQACREGSWRPGEDINVNTGRERRTIYQLYEENIGPLTPLIADTLRDAEAAYPQDWIKDAIQAAVENNVRRWNYIEAILASWKKEGRYAQTKRDYEESYRKYFQDEG